ncbi:SMC-Scp complex subunit ScpB [Amycolatopsis rhabdoformis]|uniref:SMC-Scp complex subunit ScpB n=1 Tax=Amycolatopsis rhabdoformis TaxID=1448059 RepID=A0ABZ1ILU7_9PSEU|nr:SMC-Scp complex subunit ScpB [Amycolatopsis rhabdoformis]WSE35165.1 SMC-Scp complex subunit ScpB [Amycolatopsis rhabdoformis]
MADADGARDEPAAVEEPAEAAHDSAAEDEPEDGELAAAEGEPQDEPVVGELEAETPETPEPTAQEDHEAEANASEPVEGEPAEAGGGEPEPEEGVEPLNDLPDVTSDEALEAALEALLLVIDSPANEETLAGTVDQPVARVTVALRTMAQRLTERASGIDLRRVGEGWRFYTRDTYAPFVEKLLLDGQRSKLTRAALESLAVIAYRQPVTRARVAAVRGVNVDGVIRTLLARGLIEEMGTDPETTGTLYVTTELFLERLGLSSLNDLPPIAPLLPEVDTIDDI